MTQTKLHLNSKPSISHTQRKVKCVWRAQNDTKMSFQLKNVLLWHDMVDAEWGSATSTAPLRHRSHSVRRKANSSSLWMELPGVNVCNNVKQSIPDKEHVGSANHPRGNKHLTSSTSPVNDAGATWANQGQDAPFLHVSSKVDWRCRS